VAYLLSKGANINHANSRGFTPLMNAADTGEADVVHYLLAKGADKTTKTSIGDYTLANIAHMAGHTALRDSLRAAGVTLQIEKHPDLLRWVGSPRYDATPNAYLVSGGHGCEDVDFESRKVMKPGYTLVVLGKCGGISVYDKKILKILSLFSEGLTDKKTEENLAMLLDPCGFKMSTFMVKIPLGFLPQMASFFITQGQQDRAHFKCAQV
jgi:hypothetical protein